MARLSRIAASVLLVVIALIHLNLYSREHYRAIPTVGWLFLLTVISAALLAIVEAVHPTWFIDLSAGLFVLGVLGGYLLTLYLPSGLFQFKELGISYSGAISIAAEAGTAVVVGVALWHRRRRGISNR